MLIKPELSIPQFLAWDATRPAADPSDRRELRTLIAVGQAVFCEDQTLGDDIGLGVWLYADEPIPPALDSMLEPPQHGTLHIPSGRLFLDGVRHYDEDADEETFGQEVALPPGDYAVTARWVPADSTRAALEADFAGLLAADEIAPELIVSLTRRDEPSGSGGARGGAGDAIVGAAGVRMIRKPPKPPGGWLPA